MNASIQTLPSSAAAAAPTLPFNEAKKPRRFLLPPSLSHYFTSSSSSPSSSQRSHASTSSSTHSGNPPAAASFSTNAGSPLLRPLSLASSSSSSFSPRHSAQRNYRNPNRDTLSRASDLGPTSQALSEVLKDAACRHRFRLHLERLRMEEALDCLDDLDRFSLAPSVAHAKRIIAQYCLDNSPQQVNLSSHTKHVLAQALQHQDEDEDAAALCDSHYFANTTMEVLCDIRQSDAFRFFLATSSTVA